MKILLFRDGRAGVAVTLPGDKPMEEIGELLGGEGEMERLNDRLSLVRRKDGEELALPIRHALHRIGREAEPVAGDCAVVGTGTRGGIRDISVQDIAAAECYIRALSHRAGEIRQGADRKTGRAAHGSPTAFSAEPGLIDPPARCAKRDCERALSHRRECGVQVFAEQTLDMGGFTPPISSESKGSPQSDSFMGRMER